MTEHRAEEDVCRRTNFATENVGASCTECGHTNIVHEITNRSTTANHECQLCRLEFLNGKLTRLVDRHEAYLHATLGIPDVPPDGL